MTRTITTTHEYDIEYDGGRLADVMIGGHAVECVEVRGYDGATGEFTEPEPRASLIRDQVHELMRDQDLADYRMSVGL